MNGLEFNFIADYGAENPPPPSMLFIIILGKMDIIRDSEELRDILLKLEEYGKLDSVVEAVNVNTMRALHNLHHGDDLYDNRHSEQLPDELRKNISVTLNCIISDAVKSVRLAKEVIHSYSQRPSNSTLQ